jgi:hypothetical protein
MSVKGTIAAAAATLAVVGGAAVALTLPANAATPQCGHSCVDLYSAISATLDHPSFVIDAFEQGQATGTFVILSGAGNTDPGEDFTIGSQGTVNSYFQAGLVSVLVDQNFGSDAAFELQYAPYGAPTGECVGVAATAVAGEHVTLQPCGVSGKTIWIVDSSASITGSFVSLINGSDTNFSQPYVLTYPAGASPTDQPAPVLFVTNLQAGQVPDNQLWSEGTGVLDALSLTTPADITTGATGPSGATVTYPAPVVTEVGNSSPPAAVCTPASGSVFPIGTTTVTCTVTDPDATPSTASTSFTITVKHGLSLSTPADITTDATGPSGATVTYPAPVVTDFGNPSPPAAVCTPASGSVFPIGTTTVTCTATDPDAIPSTVSISFTITVEGAAAQLADLRQAVRGVGIGNFLAGTVAIAQRQLAAGHPRLACLTLTQFILDVRLQTPWIIRAGTAGQLIADARRIQAVLGGCGPRPLF